MSDIIDKETKLFLLVLGLIVVFMLFFYPKLNAGLFTYDLTNPQGVNSLFNNTNTSSSVTIDKQKNYSAVVSTSAGDFEIDLFEHNAPANVSSFVRQANANRYSNASIRNQKDFLFKVDAGEDITTNTIDEINADVIGLNNIKVKDAGFLKDEYDPNDKRTNAFSTENLAKHENSSLKQFYSSVLKYKYNDKLITPPSKKYLVYMTSTGPDTNKSDFFVLMTDSADHINGRYTPIGQVVSGLETLDRINNEEMSDLVVTAIKINSKQ
jgi:cyclophilin family peptidyl-prolyl cis-trans isomerase